MEILGVGPSELLFIVIIAIIVLGPKDMQKAGLTIGRWLNQMTRSDLWKVARDSSRALSNLPQKLMRDANKELWEAEQDLQNTIGPQRRKSLPSQPKPTSYKSPDAPKKSADEEPAQLNATREEDTTTTDD